MQLDAATLPCNDFSGTDEPTTLAELPLPKPYGVLTQDVKVNTKQLKVDTQGNDPPTVSKLGPWITVEGERMLVTSIDSSGWSVTRTAPVPHMTGKTVASNPFPLLAGRAVPVCRWNAGKDVPRMDGRHIRIWVIDGSDGFVRIGQ